ncbi:uncharacterized protein [Cherax quadricarinatus]
MVPHVMQWLVVVVSVVMVTSNTSCSYWCHTPHKQPYCCSLPDRVYPEPQVHPGRCFTAHKGLSKIRNPEVCPHDGACSYNQKCCWNNHVGHHICTAINQVPVEEQRPDFNKPGQQQQQQPSFPVVSHLARTNVDALSKGSKP